MATINLKPGEQNILDNLVSKHPVLKEMLNLQEGGVERFILAMHAAWCQSEDYPDEEKLVKYWICDSEEREE